MVVLVVGWTKGGDCDMVVVEAVSLIVAAVSFLPPHSNYF